MKEGLWWNKSWNPVTGCSPISEGCQNCWARRMARRLRGRYGFPADDPFEVEIHLDRVKQPFQWKKSKRIFVCSMGDLFHPDVPAKFRVDVMDTIFRTPQHTYLLLTKRPKQMYDYMQGSKGRIGFAYEDAIPLPNVWLGVSVENQQRADERIPILLQIPAKIRFVSIEPMLGPVDLLKINTNKGWMDVLNAVEFIKGKGTFMSHQKLFWVVLGGETGPGARPMKYDWAFNISEQCQTAGIPLFYKQGPDDEGEFKKMPKLKGIIWDQFPEIRNLSLGR